MPQESMSLQPLSETSVLDNGSVSDRVKSGPSTSGRVVFNPPSGMALNFVAPCVNNGVVKAVVDKDEIRALKARWDYIVAMFIVGFQPNLVTFNRFVGKHWPSIAKLNIILHQDGYYLVQCSSDDDVRLIVNGRNTMMGKRPVLVRHWDKDFDFKKVILRVITIWIRLLKLPMHLWGMNNLSRIGTIFRVPIFADNPTSRKSIIQYARILVEIDVSKPLPKEVLVEDEDGSVFKQAYYAEWVPHLCPKCQLVGHICLASKQVVPKLDREVVQRGKLGCAY